MTRLTVETGRRDVLLSEPYTIAYETYDRVSLLFVRIADAAGRIGHGSASPAPEITGESVDSCAAGLQSAAARLGDDGWPPSPETRGWLDDLADRAPAAAAALDMALWDLRARRAALPLHELLGGRRAATVTSVTLGIDGLEATVRRARERAAQGFLALKIKGGRDATADGERVRAVRDAVGDGVELRFDANQGYLAEDALRFVDATHDTALTVLEQPLAAADTEGARSLVLRLRARRARGEAVPLLLADESCVRTADAARLAVTESAEALNLKLMKVGGLDAAAAAECVARGHRLPCMVSCMDESALSIAAALHWTLARPNVRWVDLDGHLDLCEDPFAGLVQLREGRLLPAEGPGLGDVPASGARLF